MKRQKKITTEEPIVLKNLRHRLDYARYGFFLVKNSPRGIIIDEELRRESWGDLGYFGDARRNRFAIEIRAKNGRVVAAVAWWINLARNNCVSTLGTYVSKALRRKGIATSLWKAMLEETRAKIVYSEPVTNEGLTLINSLREKLYGITIKIIDNDDTEFLEDLRRQKRRAS